MGDNRLITVKELCKTDCSLLTAKSLAESLDCIQNEIHSSQLRFSLYFQLALKQELTGQLVIQFALKFPRIVLTGSLLPLMEALTSHPQGDIWT